MVVESGSNQNPDKVPPSSSLSRPEEPSTPSLRHGPILLVEDNSGDILLVREVLKEHHIANELIVCTDGQRAIEFLDRIDAESSLCPVLLILDLNLPRRTGRDVLAHMRKGTHCAAIPVVVLSSSAASSDRQAALELGARLYIRKPSDLTDFMAIGAAIRQLLSPPPPI